METQINQIRRFFSNPLNTTFDHNSLDNRFLGIEIAKTFADGNIGILGYILRNAPDFAESLNLLQRYVALVSPGSKVDVIAEADDRILTYQLNLLTPDKCVQDVEGTIEQLIRMIKVVTGNSEWQPAKIYFVHEPPQESLMQNVPFETDVIYRHSFNGVKFPSEILKLRISDSDPILLEILESQVEQLCESLLSSSSLSEQLRAILMSSNEGLGLGLEYVCKELALSKRSLARKLKMEGTSFMQIRSDVVLQLAKNRLIHSVHSVTVIAQQLGYSDSSAFNRAFKKMAGSTPSEYRKMHRGL